MPREGHDNIVGQFFKAGRHFNPRAPRGARLIYFYRFVNMSQFQSTCPARGTTTIQPRVTGAASYFNPRAPRGARLPLGSPAIASSRISIHVPREGHDLRRKNRLAVQNISIHVPREGHDRFAHLERLSLQMISIHVPREGHDAAVRQSTR